MFLILNSRSNISKWLPLSIIIILSLFIQTRCSYSPTKELISEFKNELNFPNCHSDMSSKMNKAVDKSAETQFNSKKLNNGASKILNFDLNELPLDLESEMSSSEAGTISQFGDEREFNQGSNKRLLEPFSDPTSLEKPQLFSKRFKAECSSTPEIARNQAQLVTEPEANNEPLLVFKRPQLKIAQKDKNLQISKPLIKNSGTELFIKASHYDLDLQRKKSAPNLKGFRNKSGVKQNYNLMNVGIGEESKGKEKNIFKEEGVSLQNKVANFDEKNDLMVAQLSSTISLNNRLNSMISLEPKLLSTASIRNILSVEIKDSGPFDLEAKRYYCSPYNRDLLDLLEKNFSKIIPKELDVFEFNEDFLKIIKESLWRDELGIFLINDESVIKTIRRVDYDSRTNKKRPSWIKFSVKGLQSNKKVLARKYFTFRDVFNRFMNFENLSRFFFTNKIRQDSIAFFHEMNSSLLAGTKHYGKTRTRSIDAILTQIWQSMTGFLAYVHAINAIIAPSKSLEPLSQEKLVKKQEEAFKFFCDLHKDIIKYCCKQRSRKSSRTYSTFKTGNLSFEQIKDRSMNQIFNSRLSSHHEVWVYLELWLFKYRPELQEANCRYSQEKHLIKGSKFKSFINRICFMFFSAMVKNERLKQNR
ncbi:hypothetical protein BY996DRAFT_6426939 [Phakopsora pachyrhizi]|nr:hypothetical protein BY996DRAFT_6426939 [Phakopsora pachyrhizi]